MLRAARFVVLDPARPRPAAIEDRDRCFTRSAPQFWDTDQVEGRAAEHEQPIHLRQRSSGLDRQ